MARIQIGRVGGLWRYPVKSMLGEKLAEANVTLHGVARDRAWALREVGTGFVVSAKKFPILFRMSARCEGSADASDAAPVRIALPDGETIRTDDQRVSAVLSSLLGREVRLERPQAEQQNLAGIDPATVFGDVPAGEIIAGTPTETLPNFFSLPKGTFFDSAVVHVLASGTLEHMHRLAGGDSRFDPRRFRPNIFVETEGGSDGFVEDEWLGGMLEVGDTVRIAGMKPAMRCVMTTHPQEDLERDYAILRIAARSHHANVGVFASVAARGTVRVGDPVFLST